MLEQADRALELLTTPQSDPGEAVHQARRRFKRIRGVLRLVREEIGEKCYRRENACYRDAGRRLSLLRDSLVIRQTLEACAQRWPDPAAAGAHAELRRALLAADAMRQMATPEVMADVAGTIHQARRRVEAWPLRRDDFAALRGGLKPAWRSARESMKTALEVGDVESFHNWRKQTGYLRSQMRILQPLRPRALNALIRGLEQIEDPLSEDHDLALLRQWLQTVLETIPEARPAEALPELIAGRQLELRGQAEAMGRRLFAESAGDFTDRLEQYWKEARAR
ncbi:MAG: CHAD domain-containing protein [Blastocatellia bacterium]